METLKNGFQKILSEYLTEKGKPLKDNQLASFIRNGITGIISEESSIDTSKYILKGSHGLGAWADIPWICILDKEVTDTTQKGYYLAYLFDADMNKFYLSLMQGWTQYKKSFSPEKIALSNISTVSEKFRHELRTLSPKYAALKTISFNTKSSLAQGYARGHICSIEYDAKKLPNDSIFIDDLRNMLAIYSELKGLIGKKDFFELIQSLTLDDDLFIENEEIYEKKVEEAPENLNILKEDPKPKEKLSSRKGSTGEKWPRDAKISKAALSKSDFSCELDSTHTSFTSEITGKTYVEAHHLIPMNFQAEFQNSLDVLGNIVSLCPNCHRKIHHSTPEEKKSMIEELYNKRKAFLEAYGIPITLEDLLKKYNA